MGFGDLTPPTTVSKLFTVVDVFVGISRTVSHASPLRGYSAERVRTTLNVTGSTNLDSKGTTNQIRRNRCPQIAPTSC